MRLAVEQLEPIPEEEKHYSEEYLQQAKELKKSLILDNDYRIDDFNLNKTSVYIGEDVIITGKLQINYWWEVWGGWHPYSSGGVFLLIDNEPTYYISPGQFGENATFQFVHTANMVGSHKVKAVAHEAPVIKGGMELSEKSVKEKWEDLQSWIVAESFADVLNVTEPPHKEGLPDTQKECEAEGFYWYNNSCHPSLPSTQEECEAVGYSWHDNSCHVPNFFKALKNLDFGALWKYHRNESLALGVGGLAFMMMMSD